MPSRLRFCTNDLTESSFELPLIKNNGGQRYNVVTVNHVMEHLPDEPNRWINNWLKLTNNFLLVSVPIEKNPDKYSHHQYSYTHQDLQSIGEGIVSNNPNVRFIEDGLPVGVLMFKKDSLGHE